MILKSNKVAAHWDTLCFCHAGMYYLYYLILLYLYKSCCATMGAKAQ